MDKEILYSFFNNRASLDQQALVLNWLDEDPDNMKQMIAERKLFDAMLLVVESNVPDKRRSPLAMPRWVAQAVRYAAVVLIMAGVGLYYQSREQKKLLEATNTISVPAGQRVDVVLPDGTKVCMNALSQLKYPSFFAGKLRKVELTGEAFFDVTHDAKHPFVVETYACDVEVLGTKFNVEARSARGEFIASLLDGKVKVVDRADPTNSIVLSPHQMVSYRDRRLVVSEIPSHENFQWREGLISFRNASFMELIGEFEKYYGVKIEVQSKSISQSVFTGKIRVSEGIDHALWVLQQSSVFRYSRNEQTQTIYIK